MFSRFFLLPLFFLSALSACTPTNDVPTRPMVYPSPTTHPIFAPKTSLPTLPTEISPLVSLETTPTALSPVFPEEVNQELTVVFDEALNLNWGLEASSGMTFTETDTLANTGAVSLSVTGQEDEHLTFKVLSTSPDRYLHEQTISLNFWLNTGETELDVDQLLVEILGSTNVFYWVRNDTSATVNLDTFSGKRMYGLGLNRLLETNTWVQIEILLDELVFDPTFDDTLVDDPFYDYVTGFALHFVEGFSGTIYLDDIELLLVEN